MSTPRKRLTGVAVEQLRTANAAATYAIEQSREASEKRNESRQLLEQIRDLDFIKRNPAYVERAVLLIITLHADSATADSEARNGMLETKLAIRSALDAEREE